jgi:hypothetical protein
MELHRRNFFQWNREARVRGARSPRAVMRLKREIDASNGQRAALTERLDEITVALLPEPSSRELSELYINSDTIGQLVDKLSILTLRIASAPVAPERGDGGGTGAPEVRDRSNELLRQKDYLAACYDRLLAQLRRGEAAMPVWRHFKSYALRQPGS